MNHDPQWGQLGQNADGSFEDFLADVNVGDFSDIDFTDLDKDGSILDFARGSMEEGTAPAFVSAGSDAQLMNAQRQYSGPVRTTGWQGSAGVGPQQGYVSQESAIAYQQHAQAFSPQQQQQQQQHAQYGTIPRPNAIPPTPNSLEMHGKQPTFNTAEAHHARAVYDSYARKQQDQMVFTPLVSPAVTPLDSQFQIPEYTIPGEYFTPLTSPAMQAQASQQRSIYGSVRDSDTSEAASPSDMEIDTSPRLSTKVPASSSKGKKSVKTKPQPRSVRHSPAMKAQRKKAPTSAAIAAKDVVEAIDEIATNGSNGSSRPGSSSLPLPGGSASAASSISPEPMSEILMPPPATPRSGSKGRSPNLGPLDGARMGSDQNSPATPATLMRLRNTGAHSRSTQSSAPVPSSRSTPTLLPNLPNIRSAPSQIDGTSVAAGLDGDKNDLRLKAAPVPPSPSGSTHASGSGNSRGALKGRKRSISSHPSPALRPRMSPNIKPLLPEGSQGISAETSALLLASKSNYQNIIEGNHLPGVNYPNALSANLTSKRTSHKLAEQGRRNRMNTALQELATLLPAVPPSPTVPGREAQGSASSPSLQASKSGALTPTPGNIGANSGANKDAGASSKASTVELAIEFIKALQGELGDAKGRLAAAEQALNRSAAALPEDQSTPASVSSTTSEPAPT